MEKKQFVITGTMVCFGATAIGIIVSLASAVIYTVRGSGTFISFFTNNPTMIISLFVCFDMFFVTLAMLLKKKGK